MKTITKSADLGKGCSADRFTDDSMEDLKMTLIRARLIVRNRLAYAPREVREAAVWLLGSMSATQEDIHDASHAIAIGTRDR